MAPERNFTSVGWGDGGMWVVLPLGEHWSSFVRFAIQDGHPVVAELRILPRVDKHLNDVKSDDWAAFTAVTNPGVWARVSGRIAPPERDTPEGGLTKRALRDVQLQTALELAYAELAEEIKQSDVTGLESFLPAGVTKAAVDARRRPGRKGRDDFYYVEVAVAYVDALKAGSRKPVEDAAQALSNASGGTYTAPYVRDLLHVARQRDLLTRPPKGRAGGQLTDKARALLQREGTE